MVAVLMMSGLFGFVLFEAMRTARRAAADFDPHATAFVLPAPVPRHQLVTFSTSAGDRIAASFIAPTNGVAVIVGHGTPGSRADLWSDVVLLANAGFGVLAIDWPGHGESTGRLTFGEPERAAFAAAVDFLVSRDDVEVIGAYGYSNGGSLAVLHGGADNRVRAILAVNAWADAREQVFHEHRSWGPLRQYPAWWGCLSRMAGGNISLVDVAPKLRGRPTLFIGADDDAMVPPTSAQRLADAAGGEWRLVPGAGHGDVRERMGDWPEVLLGFFSEQAPR